MKKFFLIFLTIFLASCQNVQNTPPENPVETATGTEISQKPETEKILQKYEPIVSDWPEFNRPFGEKFELDKDFCVKDICIKAGTPVYQDENGEIVQAQLVRQHVEKVVENGDNEYSYHFYEFLEMETKTYEDGEKSLITIGKTHEELEKLAEKFDGDAFIEVYIRANPSKNFISKEKTDSFTIEAENCVEVKKWVFLKIDSIGGCGGFSHEQIFVDIHGNEMKNISEIFGEVPQKFTKWALTFTLDTEKMKDFSPGRRLLGYSDEFFEEVTISLKNFEADMNKIEGLGYNNFYVVNFEEIPYVHFVYKSNLPFANRFLTGSLANISTNEKWEIMDLELTKKLMKDKNFVSFYDMDDDGVEKSKSVFIRKKGETDDYDGIDFDNLSAENLPIFKILKTTENEALLYVTNGYEEFTTAEFCKPVVYVYDKNPSKNSLSVGLPQGGDFTKLIPNFSYGNTWDFVANNASKIASNGQKLDYLYYSARVPNYTFNENGWQVYGRDMVKFFEEKLDYIGFNATEKKDFIDFWKTEFHENQLYFVSFKFNDEIAKYATLDFVRKPVSQFRVLLEAYPLEIAPRKEFLYPFAAAYFDEKLLKKFSRSGEYDVFEWGGVVQKDKFSEILVR